MQHRIHGALLLFVPGSVHFCLAKYRHLHQEEIQNQTPYLLLELLLSDELVASKVHLMMK